MFNSGLKKKKINSSKKQKQKTDRNNNIIINKNLKNPTRTLTFRQIQTVTMDCAPYGLIHVDGFVFSVAFYTTEKQLSL